MKEEYSAPLSPEVRWYLETRGYELADDHAVPLWRTPEPDPRKVDGLRFDPARVDAKINALSKLKHTKGKWAGEALKPAAIQVAYIIAPIFGWVAPDDDGDMQRVIREAYVEMPRKGAKTTLSSGLATLLAFADGEAGAEVIMGAASKDQAGAAFKPIAALVRGSQLMAKAGIKARAYDVVQPSSGSTLKVVSSRGDLAHGANVHGAVVDELHVHKNGDLLEAIESGTGARSQPLTFVITTADDGQTTSVYAQRREYIEKLCKGTLKSTSQYGVVWAARATDDPFSEETVKKCNPLYPVTPTRAFIKTAMEKAQASPVALNSYLRLHLGIRANVGKAFFNLPKWDANGGLVDELALRGSYLPAYGGLDLASVSDLCALVWVFPVGDGSYTVLCRFWTPEDNIPALDARTAGSASGWVRQGYLRTTPGAVVDYEYIKKQVLEDSRHFSVEALGYDKWNSSQLILDLKEQQLTTVKVSQTVAALSAPLKEIERLVLSGNAESPRLRHGGNPILRWMADNTRVYADANGNIKPNKDKSTEKIDGISALTMAMSLVMGAESNTIDYGNLTIAGGS